MKRHNPDDLSDEQVNHTRRFAGLPPLDVKELKTWRGYLRWMQGRFAPRPGGGRRQRAWGLSDQGRAGKRTSGLA